MPALPILIVGQGLAGTALAWTFWRQGIAFSMVDPGRPETCSKVAAGLVTPITGKRVKASWRIDEFLPAALEFYRYVEKQVGAALYHPRPMLRLFRDSRERAWWENRVQSGELKGWLSPRSFDPGGTPYLHAEFGGFEQRHCGWLDTPAYLEASRRHFTRNGALASEELHDDDVSLQHDHVAWRGRPFEAIVFCRGADERNASRFFSWLSFECARGAVLDIRADVPDRRIINRGCWVLPHGGDRWRAGSNYDFQLQGPREPLVRELQDKLKSLLRVPFKVTGVQAGVRPILKQKPLAVGRHPAHPRVILFNGLGSKGVLRAPFFAGMLTRHLIDDGPIDATVDVASNDIF